MKAILNRVLAVFFVGTTVIAVAIWLVHDWGTQPRSIETPIELEIPRGSSSEVIAELLEQRSLISHRFLFKVWLRAFGHPERYQAGLYQFVDQVSPEQIDEFLRNGRVYSPVVLQFVIPEGFTLQQVLRRLEANGVGTYEELSTLAHDRKFLDDLNISNEAKSLEGYLYPATYSFIRKRTAREVLAHMVETFWQKLPDGYIEGLKKKRLSLHKAVTFASLIEMETLHDDERPKIAEVIWSRLRNGEPLAIDAALIYGIKDYQGDIKWKHLKDRKNPYNTRVHKGLPPGPIGSVSQNSLAAVLSPTDEGFYYYVLKYNSGGRHHFSKTLKEHNQHVRRLVEAQKGER